MQRTGRDPARPIALFLQIGHDFRKTLIDLAQISRTGLIEEAIYFRGHGQIGLQGQRGDDSALEQLKEIVSRNRQRRPLFW